MLPPKIGFKRRKNKRTWKYVWVGIPNGFNAWRDALEWNPRIEMFDVISRVEKYRLRMEEYKAKIEIEENYISLKNYIGEFGNVLSWIRSKETE